MYTEHRWPVAQCSFSYTCTATGDMNNTQVIPEYMYASGTYPVTELKNTSVHVQWVYKGRHRSSTMSVYMYHPDSTAVPLALKTQVTI